MFDAMIIVLAVAALAGLLHSLFRWERARLQREADEHEQFPGDWPGRTD